MEINLGKAWASNTINTVIFRQSGIFTFNNYQFCSYYINEKIIHVIRRDLRNDKVQEFNLGGEYNIKDAHNSISMGYDSKGFIHLSYNQHCTPLQYRRSLKPLDISSWSEELPMTGKFEDFVTYPCFLYNHKFNELLFIYRDGIVENGAMRIKKWNTISREWIDSETTILTGSDQKPWSSNPYWNSPRESKNGVIHFIYTWRTKSIDEGNLINNINIGYLKTPDCCQSWYFSNNKKASLPITQVNSEVIFPVSPGENLINQSGMAIDKKGNPHAVFYSNDINGIPQYQHLWFDGASWHHSFITSRNSPFLLSGKGTLTIPISRPDIVIDKNNRVYIIYRGDHTDNFIVAQRLLPPDYHPIISDFRILWNQSVNQAEPIIDHDRWRDEEMLSLLIQNNHQPNEDGFCIDYSDDVQIIDIDLTSLWGENEKKSKDSNEKSILTYSTWLENVVRHNSYLSSEIGRLEKLNQEFQEENIRYKESNTSLLNENAKYKERELKIEKQTKEIQTDLFGLKNYIEDFSTSRTWRIALFFLEMSRKMFPEGSLRRNIVIGLWSLIKNKKVNKSLRSDVDLVESSGFFNEEWYLEKNTDVGRTHIKPVVHYIKYGGFEGRDPGPNFSSSKYLDANVDVKSSNINPLVHFLKYGQYEGRTIDQIGHKIIVNNSSDKKGTLADNLIQNYYSYTDQTRYEEEEKGLYYEENSVKLIAFYLPQYYPFEENDTFWGKGFTEWNNVTRGFPLFYGHNQPRFPGELGYYDTRNVEILYRQAELAKDHGIFGFCFHHYWFNGQKVMRVPLQHLLTHKDIDLPFCLHWANEPWTARFDGHSELGGVLIDQKHTPKDDIDFISDIIPVLEDSRYIKINGKPVLLIYRPHLFPDIKATIDRWNNFLIKENLQLYLIMVETNFNKSETPKSLGFDASVEFPPHRLNVPVVNKRIKYYIDDFNGFVYEYDDAIEYSLRKTKVNYDRFRGVMLAWDNSPRNLRPNIFRNFTPEKYQKWLEAMILETKKNMDIDKQYVFINAWNEWGEGTYLEPDRRFGYALLNSTSRALQRTSKK